ncbi:MAG TPA: restriction endonuclease [Candidatus Elarobacter sp.]|nr:restriction endonuclease [Candidatus Elarobacter sp.]
MPQFHELFNSILAALRELGDSAGLSELEVKVAELAQINDATVDVPHVRNRGTVDEVRTPQTEFSYRLRWALTYLKKAGYVNNSQRGVWSLTEQGRSTGVVDSRVLVSLVQAQAKASRHDGEAADAPLEDVDVEESAEQEWSEKALATLLELKPDAFERLSQRLLREIGFVEVRVLGRSGDGGIDGRGLLRLNEVISLGVVFQCKRYNGTVGPDAIRDFRGGMQGKADRGLLITTASFTSGAVREASRDGAMSVDLIDGTRLVQLLKKYKLGVNTSERVVEDVTVDEAWFSSV